MIQKKIYAKNIDIVNEIIFPGMIALGVLFMTMWSGITFGQGMVYLLFQIFGILIPGRAFIDFLGIKKINSVEKVAWGYAFGYIVNIVQYFCLAAFGRLEWMRWLQILVSVVAIVILSIKRKNTDTADAQSIIVERKEWLPIGISLGISMAIRFFTYYGRNLLPTRTQDVTFPVQDILFYVGNAISATKGFPVEEFRFAGQQFYYHYFGSVQLGVTSLVTGIDALSLELCLAWMQPILLLIPSFWCLLRRMNICYKKSVLGLFIFLFTAGWELIVYVAYQHIMYVTPFGWDIGLAFGVLTVTFMYMQYQSTKVEWGIWLAVLLTFFVCEGSKAPLAVVILSVFGCVCALWLIGIQGKRYLAFVYGIPLLLGFIVIFFGIVSNGFSTVTTNTSGLKFSLTGHLYECGLGKMYFEWTNRGMSQILGKVLILVFFYFGCNLVTYYLFAINSAYLIGERSIKRILTFEGCLLVGVCCGLILTLITKQTGNSQMYFAMTAFPLALIFSLKVWNGHAYKKRLFYGGLIVSLLLSGWCFIQILYPSIVEGYEKISGKSDFSQESNSLTYEEMQAYQWIRENTEEDAICINNVITTEEQYQSFIVGVCTERQQYMEGWRYVIGVMEAEQVFERREEVCAFYNGEQLFENGILEDKTVYVIWTQRYGTTPAEIEHLLGSKVFDNGAVKVYRFAE